MDVIFLHLYAETQPLAMSTSHITAKYMTETNNHTSGHVCQILPRLT